MIRGRRRSFSQSPRPGIEPLKKSVFLLGAQMEAFSAQAHPDRRRRRFRAGLYRSSRRSRAPSR